MSCTSEVPRPSSAAICRLDRFRPMKERHNTQIRNGWWCPASTVPLRSSKRDAHAWQRYRCRCGCVSSCPFRTTASLSHPGQRTPSGQRCWRTKAKHFASSSRDARLTGSTVAMMTGPPCSPATADRLKPSSYLNPPPQASITPEADKSHTRNTKIARDDLLAIHKPPSFLGALLHSGIFSRIARRPTLMPTDVDKVALTAAIEAKLRAEDNAGSGRGGSLLNLLE